MVGLALVAGGLAADLEFLLLHVLRHVVAGGGDGVHRGDLHRHVAAGVLSVALALHLDDHAELGTGVDVGHDLVAVGGLDDLEAADFDLLADLARHVGHRLADRTAALEVERVQRVEIGGALAEDDLGDLVGVAREVLVTSYEVGLGVHLGDHADRVVVGGGDGDDAFGGLALGALVGHLLALLAEQLDGGVEVTVGLFEGLLAVHHPDAGGVAEALDVFGGNRRHGCGCW